VAVFARFMFNSVLELEADRYHFVETDSPILIFSNFFNRYLVNCRYSIGRRYRYSKICLPGIFTDIL